MFISARITDQWNVYQECRAPLEALEVELNRPIRVLRGPVEPRDWHHTHVTGSFSLEDARERGITLWHHTFPTPEDAFGRFSVTFDGHNAEALTGMRMTWNTADPDRVNYPILAPHVSVHSVGTRMRERGIIADEWHPVVGCILGPREVVDFVGAFTQDAAPMWLGTVLAGLVQGIRDSCADDLAANWDAIQAANREKQFENFAASLTGSRTEELRKSIDEQIALINDYNERLVIATRKAESDDEMLRAILAGREGAEDNRLIRDFKMLQEHPRVQSIEFNSRNEIVILTTDDLRIVNADNGDSRWLGQFKIVIGFTQGRVQLFNLSTPRYDRAHPHVGVNGQPCFGGHQNEINAIVKRGDLYTLYEFLLQYLETLNTSDSWGAYGAYWFDVPDERPETSPSTPEGVVAA